MSVSTQFQSLLGHWKKRMEEVVKDPYHHQNDLLVGEG